LVIFALLFLTMGLLVSTLLPLWRCPHWLVRGLDFPRLQFAAAAAVLLMVDGVILDPGEWSTWALMAAALFCFAWQFWWIAPYTPLWRQEVRPAPEGNSAKRVSIITANVLTPNRNARKLLALVGKYQPDVLVTLESDQWWQDQLDVLEKEMPHAIKCPLDNLYGMHVYSRLPLEETEIAYLVQDDIPSMHALLRLRTGDAVRIHFLHPAPPSPTENPESSERDAELVIVARSVADDHRPIIVTGDLNDVAWSETTRLFRKISGLLDPRVGRGMFNTFHAKYPLIRWPLDHIFHSRHFTVRTIKRLPPIGSDHFALLTELCYTPLAGAGQNGLEAESADRKKAREIAKEKNVSKEAVPQPRM
jgi:endonuclease/exonuclease/phosphatase (EEP) superfamily protein YafD